MYIPFQEMPAQARIWVYQASRSLQAQELDQIKQTLTQSCQVWEAHGAPLQSARNHAGLHDAAVSLSLHEAENQGR